MSEDLHPVQLDAAISRRSLLRSGAAVAALAVLPADARASTLEPARRSSSSAVPNVRVSHDRYGDHVGPSLAANPRHPSHLFVACQGSPKPPEFIATYLSFDGGASWQPGGRPPQPTAGPAGDDVNVAFDAHGRVYICAARSGNGARVNPSNPSANRAVYIWRSDDDGRSFSEPATVVAGTYSDHPWVATGQDRNPSGNNVYVAWASGNSHTALELARSTDGGASFEPPRRILPEASIPSLVSAGPQLAAGAHGLVCTVCDWTSQMDSTGDVIGQVTAVCSTDGGRSFGAPVHLGSETATIALPRNVKPNSGPTVAISPIDNAIYVAFPKRKPGTSHSNIVVTVSHDRGRTWSEPVPATPDDHVTYFQPNLAVDDAGRVAISAFALAGGRIDEVLLISRPRELRFRQPVRVTTSPFDPLDKTTAFRGKYGAWWIGDWQGIAGSAGAFHLVWNDTRTGALDLFAATVRA